MLAKFEIVLGILVVILVVLDTTVLRANRNIYGTSWPRKTKHRQKKHYKQKKRARR